MSESKENDLLKKPVKANSTTNDNNRIKKVHVKEVLTTLSDSEFESLIASLSYLDPEAKSKIEDIITAVRDNRTLRNKDVGIVAKLDVKSSAKVSRSCTLL
jgi:hypothetical protein